MASWKGVITNAGASLLASWAQGGTLNIGTSRAGQGTVSESALISQTGLVLEKQEMSIVQGTSTESGRKIELRISAPEQGYTMNQIGIWASVNDESPVLLALYQTSDGISIPSRSESPEFMFTFYAVLSISNTGNLTLNIDMSAYVTRSDLEILDAKLQGDIAEVEAHVEDLEYTIRSTQRMIAYDWSESVKYKIGDYVNYDNDLYRAIADNQGSRPSFRSTVWTSAKATEFNSEFNTHFNKVDAEILLGGNIGYISTPSFQQEGMTYTVSEDKSSVKISGTFSNTLFSQFSFIFNHLVLPRGKYKFSCESNIPFPSDISITVSKTNASQESGYVVARLVADGYHAEGFYDVTDAFEYLWFSADFARGTYDITLTPEAVCVSSMEYKKTIILTNITVPTTAFVEDDANTEFPYKADIVCEGVSSQYFADVVFGIDDAIGGNYAPVSETGHNTTTIFAKEIPTSDLVIPAIRFQRG